MKTVLLVDDSAVFVRVLDTVLKSEYLILGRAQDGEQGVQMYQKLKPDIVLLDITMPNVNGKECLARIMENDPIAKIIMVTSLGDEGTIDECLKLGARGFVRKDLVTLPNKSDNALLFSTIAKVLEESQSEAA